MCACRSSSTRPGGALERAWQAPGAPERTPRSSHFDIAPMDVLASIRGAHGPGDRRTAFRRTRCSLLRRRPTSHLLRIGRSGRLRPSTRRTGQIDREVRRRTTSCGASSHSGQRADLRRLTPSARWRAVVPKRLLRPPGGQRRYFDVEIPPGRTPPLLRGSERSRVHRSSRGRSCPPSPSCAHSSTI